MLVRGVTLLNDRFVFRRFREKKVHVSFIDTLPSLERFEARTKLDSLLVMLFYIQVLHIIFIFNMY